MKDASEIKRMCSDNPYVDSIDDEGKIRYTQQFYTELYQRIEYGRMERLAAYVSLGFDIDVVGKSAAKQAAYRAVKMGKKIIKKNPSEYDSTLSVSEMLEKAANGEYDKDDLIANLISHSVFLEEVDRSKKKDGHSPDG